MKPLNTVCTVRDCKNYKISKTIDDPQEAGVNNIRGEAAQDRHDPGLLMEKDMVKSDSFCPLNNVEEYSTVEGAQQTPC